MDQRRTAAERLFASYSRFYGITRFDGMDAPETEGVREALKLSVPQSLRLSANTMRGTAAISCFGPTNYGRRSRRSSFSSSPARV